MLLLIIRVNPGSPFIIIIIFLLTLALFQAIKIKTVLSHFITFIWGRNNAKARPELTQNVKHGEGGKRRRPEKKTMAEFWYLG